MKQEKISPIDKFNFAKFGSCKESKFLLLWCLHERNYAGRMCIVHLFKDKFVHNLKENKSLMSTSVPLPYVNWIAGSTLDSG